MTPVVQILVAAAVRFYAPVLVVFSLSLLLAAQPGSGQSFVGGLLFTLAPALHALAFGAAAARRAFPPTAARVLLAGGVLAVLAGQTIAADPVRAYLTEAGVFAATAASAVLIVAVLAGRAPTLADADW